MTAPLRSHGGDIYRNAVTLDFSANVNPLGTPEPVRRAVREAAERLAAYPDPEQQQLRQALSAHHGLPAEQILCGNGAAELIFQFAAAVRPRQALLPVPCFAEYAAALEAVDCRVTPLLLSRADGFALRADLPRRITDTTDALILCNPNNPTGRLIERPLLEDILRRCRQTGTQLLLDECFLDFTEEGEAASLLPLLRPGDPVLVLRAFTKMYGMAGVRLGYAVAGDPALPQEMRRRSQPWNVSTPAQAAGLAALGCRAFVEQTRALIRTERARMQRELTRLGLEVLEGAANFLLFWAAPGLREKLLKQGILIRSCASFPGLDDTAYRIAIRTRPENEQLIAAIECILMEDNDG